MNRVIAFLFLASMGFASYNHILWLNSGHNETAPSPMHQLSSAILESCKSATTLALGLIGIMAFFLGLMKLAERSHLVQKLSVVLSPFLRRIFPDIPEGHPANGAILMNFTANMLGLANAATPFGIKAMESMNSLNTKKGEATRSMVMFLGINTSSIVIVPTGIIALRAAAGASDPAAILVPTLFASLFSTLVAIAAATFLCRKMPRPHETLAKPPPLGRSQWTGVVAILGSLIILWIWGRMIAPFLLPGLICGLILYSLVQEVSIYDALIDGAKEGFEYAVKIIPFLVVILVAIGMFRASGALVAMNTLLDPLSSLLGISSEVFPMAFMRSLSGSGSYALLGELLQNPDIGVDSATAFLASTLQGSTETTFYILAVYYGAIQIKRIHGTLWVGLIADAASFIGAVMICNVY